MLDVGLGEVVLMAVLALLVFGPDRLPKVAADAARTLRQVRAMATSARKDLADAAGLDRDDELSTAVRDLDPRRLFAADAPPVPNGPAAPPVLPAQRPAGPSGSAGQPAPAADGTGSGVPSAPAADPDWT